MPKPCKLSLVRFLNVDNNLSVVQLNTGKYPQYISAILCLGQNHVFDDMRNIDTLNGGYITIVIRYFLTYSL